MTPDNHGMSPADAARILAVAAIYDRRTVGEADAMAWADALSDKDPRECAEAVREHYRDSTAWCMPAHIRAIVERRRRDAALRRKDAATLRGIEQATLEHDRERAHNHYLEASRMVAEAIARNKAARGETVATDEPADETADESA
jgi:hypothetical protein